MQQQRIAGRIPRNFVRLLERMYRFRCSLSNYTT
jgi:hypothetical protein